MNFLLLLIGCAILWVLCWPLRRLMGETALGLSDLAVVEMPGLRNQVSHSRPGHSSGIRLSIRSRSSAK